MDEKERYILVTEHYEKQLVSSVNKKMQEGYMPYGNVAIACNEAGVVKMFVQPMLLTPPQ